MGDRLQTLPLPPDPMLAAWSAALNDSGHWAVVVDAEWRLAFVTDDARLSFGDLGEETAVPIGSHYYSPENLRFMATRVGGAAANPDFWRASFRKNAGALLAGTPGGSEELRRRVDPAFVDLVDDLAPREVLNIYATGSEMRITFGGADVGANVLTIRIGDVSGACAGFCILSKPAAGMSQLAVAAATADLAHLETMRVVARPDRRPAAILMADLEASTLLARRLSAAQYFAFGRRFVREADLCVINAGGIVGRHAGDGVVAFFLAETAGSESAAARSCIMAARALQAAGGHVAVRSDIPASDVSLRFGLHWGAMVYLGRILTAGRSEVTGLGDEVNEAARIEACATGGRTLASKPLIERLNRSDAEALGIQPDRTAYTPLADLPTATQKARRDAPAIAVCDVQGAT